MLRNLKNLLIRVFNIARRMVILRSSADDLKPFDILISLLKAEKGGFDTIKSESAGLYIRYKTTLESLFKRDISELNDCCGIWIFGEPGSGKDYCVYSICKNDLYVKSINKYWDGYRNKSNAY